MKFGLVVKQNRPAVDLKKTKILYDWLTFSCDRSFEDICHIMFGSKDIPWEFSKGSNRFYEYMAVYQHIRIYYTISAPDFLAQGYHQGCCVEMSGQGCREYEDIDYRSLDDLINLIKVNGWHVARLDVAFDDKNNHFPIFDMDELARAALAREFTARSNKFKVDYSACDHSEDMGISVQHGSRSSDFYLRVYDKRAERGVFDKVAHWVRCEMQLKNEVACGFVAALGSVGQKFRAALAHYINYRVPSDTDTNKRRWIIAHWWQKLLDGVQAVAMVTRCFTSYNKSKLDDFVYKRSAKAIVTAMITDGLPTFLASVFESLDSVFASKYTSCIAAVTGVNPDCILGGSLIELYRYIGYLSEHQVKYGDTWMKFADKKDWVNVTKSEN